jgi:PAS domain S-box-containing protein
MKWGKIRATNKTRGFGEKSNVEMLSQSVADERIRDRRARDLFEAIDDAVFVHDLEGRILDANPAACRRLGYSREELLQLTTRQIDAPEFAGDFQARLKQQLAKGRLTCEGRHRTKDGRIIPVDINTSTIQIDGQPAILAVIRDISSRKTSERRRAADYAVTHVLAESPTLEDAAPKILQAIGESVGWEMGAVWEVDPKANEIRCAAVWHSPGVAAPEFEELCRRSVFAPGVGLPGRVWASGQPAWIVDVAGDKNFPRASAAVKEGMHGAFAFPVRHGLEVVSVVEFSSHKVQSPDDDLLPMITTNGSQIGQFIERQRIGQALKESEAFYHSLVESLPQNILRKDRQGAFTFANQRACSLMGKSLDQIVGRTDFDLFPADLAAKYRQDDLKVMGTGKNLEVVEKHQTPSGETLYVQVVKTPIYDFLGEIIGSQVFFWDVTERKRAEEAVVESERRYRQLTEAALDAIVVADQAGSITLFNPAAERTFGYSASEVVGRPLTQLMPPEYADMHRRGFERYVQTRVPHIVGRTVELLGRRKDGSQFPLELSLSAIDVGGELQFQGAIRDLTERNRMRDMVVQNEKLASIGLLSAGVAHEINNPLAFVANNLVVLERDNKALMALLDIYDKARGRLAQVDPDSARKAQELADQIDLPYVRDNLDRVLTRTREGVQRVTRIVQSLRGLARTTKPDFEEAHLPDIVDMSLDMIRGRLQRRGISVDLDFGPSPKIRCVTTQLGQVLLNLLVNALQAIEATNRSEGGRIRISSRNQNGEMRIEVADNGTGIPPEHLPKLFDPFFTTKPVGEGTGLGLSISHGIITGHGGRIEVDSRPGQGTTFRIFLPLHANRGNA